MLLETGKAVAILEMDFTGKLFFPPRVSKTQDS